MRVLFGNKNLQVWPPLFQFTQCCNVVPVGVGKQDCNRVDVVAFNGADDAAPLIARIDDPGAGVLLIAHDVAVGLVWSHNDPIYEHYLLLIGITDGSGAAFDVHAVEFGNGLFTVLFSH